MQAGPPAEFWIAFLVCFGLILVVAIAIQILFLLTLYRTQSAVAERNREIQPGTIWWTILINLIPIVGIFWSAYLVTKLANSLRREFEDRNWRTADEGFGRTMGMIWAWGSLVSAGVTVLQNIAQFAGQMEMAMILGLLNLPIGLTIFVCWIIYWVQMYQYGKRLREGHRGYARGSIEEDFDDQYRRPRDEDDYEREDERRRLDDRRHEDN